MYFIQRSRVEDETFQWVCERLRWAGIDGRYDLEVSELAGDARRRGVGAGESSAISREPS